MEELRKKVETAMALIRKNYTAIVVNGRIPKQYVKAYKGLLQKYDDLLSEYVFRTVTNDWAIGDMNTHENVFVQEYMRLISQHAEEIKKALQKGSMDELDTILEKLSDQFCKTMNDTHIQWMRSEVVRMGLVAAEN